VLNIVWKMKGAYHFHTPVDPIKWNCPDYFDIVKNAMDFGTIKTRLNNNIYKRCQDFYDDIKLVFYNCILYNGLESDVGKIGSYLEKEFETVCYQHNLFIFMNHHPQSQPQIHQQQAQPQSSNQTQIQIGQIGHPIQHQSSNQSQGHSVNQSMNNQNADYTLQQQTSLQLLNDSSNQGIDPTPNAVENQNDDQEENDNENILINQEPEVQDPMAD